MAFQRWKRKKKEKKNARKAIRSEPSKRETGGIRSRRPIPDTWHFRRGLKFRIFIRIRAEYRVWCSREGTVLLVDKSIGQRRAWRAWNPSRKWNFLEWAPPRLLIDSPKPNVLEHRGKNVLQHHIFMSRGIRDDLNASVNYDKRK